jgi:hypothetical protein
MTKEKLIERISKLGWGDILWGYDKEGKLININYYDKKRDLFGGYGEEMRYTFYTFEELPLVLSRA